MNNLVEKFQYIELYDAKRFYLVKKGESHQLITNGLATIFCESIEPLYNYNGFVCGIVVKFSNGQTQRILFSGQYFAVGMEEE